MTAPKNTPEKSYLEGLTKAELIEHIKRHSAAMEKAAYSPHYTLELSLHHGFTLGFTAMEHVLKAFNRLNALNRSLSGMTADEAMQYFDENSECLKKMLDAAKP